MKKYITEEDVRSLIDAKITETKTIEYKGWEPENVDPSKLVALVAAMANTKGGTIFLNIAEDSIEKGVPSRIMGWPVSVFDEKRRTVEQALNARISPTIAGLDLYPIPMAGSDEVVVALYVPKSYFGPHQVQSGNRGFPKKLSGGIEWMDVEELRQAFSMSEDQVERLRKYRMDVVQPLMSSVVDPVLNIVIAPIDAFAPGQRRDLSGLEKQSLYPLGTRGYNPRPVFEGYLSEAGEGGPQSTVKVDRRGILVATTHGISGKTKVNNEHHIVLDLRYWENEIVRRGRQWLEALRSMDIEVPMLLFLNYLNTKTVILTTHYQRYPWWNSKGVTELQLLTEEIVLKNNEVDFATAIKPAFDDVARAFGLPRSLCYGGDGKWIGEQ